MLGRTKIGPHVDIDGQPLPALDVMVPLIAPSCWITHPSEQAALLSALVSPANVPFVVSSAAVT
jgi:hypothetical protein